MSCNHRIVVEGICRECRSGVTRPNDAFLQPFNNLADGLSLSHEFVGSLKSRVSRNSLQEKKLHLVLSLYGTLFDTQTFPRLSNKEKYLKGKVNSRDDLDLWQTRILGREVLVKLRPFVHEFLREANKLFILHVHTLCIPEYADFVLKFLDPNQVYFGNRIISISKHVMLEKTLDPVLVGEREVVILDDRYDVWCSENRSNLLQITTYSYFKATKKNNSHDAGGGMFKNIYKFLLKMFSRDDDRLSDSSASYCEQGKDESVDDGALANALSFLTKISKHVMLEKTLDPVLVGEREVVILDDRYDVWCSENRSNLLQITTYSYFKATKKNNSHDAGGGMFKNIYKFLLKMFSRDDDRLSDSSASYCEQGKDESVDDGALANALSFLTKIHHSFFNHHYNEDDNYKRDVRIFLH